MADVFVPGVHNSIVVSRDMFDEIYTYDPSASPLETLIRKLQEDEGLELVKELFEEINEG